MIGLAMMLHFGLFALLAQMWRFKGIDAAPLMDRPTRAMSVSDFWGNRWNRAFRDLTFRFIFQPLAKSKMAGGLLGRLSSRLGRAWAPGALLIAFVASGLVHDLVISLPAGRGFGLPTMYFSIQGLGLLVQRSRLGKLVGLDGGAARRRLCGQFAWATIYGGGCCWTCVLVISPCIY
jgi:hypothetical protein